MTVLTGGFAAETVTICLPGKEAQPAQRRGGTGPAADPQPEDITLYLRHVEGGETIRGLAREAGCHASTILRRIRRIEERRDDPLVDRALIRASEAAGPETEAAKRRETEQFRRILRRLSESGALLVTSEAMEKAIVVRDGIRTAVLERSLAEKMALQGWLSLKERGKMRHYAISAAGRTALRSFFGQRGNGLTGGQEQFQDAIAVPRGADTAGFEESGVAFDHGDRHRIWAETELTDPETGERRRMRINQAESPVRLLARRRTAGGEAFLSSTELAAAERLREDFELAQLGPRVTQNWDRFLTAGCNSSGFGRGFGGGSESARNRVALALRELGPGMDDLCLRVCCFLEGIETTERRLGWSARSGKVVLKLALMRLVAYYRLTYGDGMPMIG